LREREELEHENSTQEKEVWKHNIEKMQGRITIGCQTLFLIIDNKVSIL
jgi:hypothetical protein